MDSDGITATGTLARVGIVAADWKVYPPGTYIYIDGIGVYTVEDRGSAVQGHHFDIFFNTRQEALAWGVKKIIVYAL